MGYIAAWDGEAQSVAHIISDCVLRKSTSRYKAAEIAVPTHVVVTLRVGLGAGSFLRRRTQVVPLTGDVPVTHRGYLTPSESANCVA